MVFIKKKFLSHQICNNKFNLVTKNEIPKFSKNVLFSDENFHETDIFEYLFAK